MKTVLVTVLMLAASSAYAAAERGWAPLVRGSVPAGEAHGTAPTSRGTIALAPEAKELAPPPAPYLWSLALLEGKLLAGSGDAGEIWLVPEDGSAARVRYAGAPALQAQSLAVLGEKLVAGLNPGAKVVRLSGEGKAETLFQATSEQYVWALLPNPRGGSLHVAVGSPGRIYRIEPGQGTPPKVELEAGDGAVRSLAFAKDGHLLAGTDGRGLVERVESNGSRFVLFNAPRREISSLSVAPEGTIWFAAIGQPSPDPTVSAATPPDPKKGPPGLLYKMRPDGFAELVWTAPGPTISSLLASGDGVLVATGDPGAVWRIEGDGSSRKVLDPSAGQVTALLPAGNDTLVATANPSKVFRMSNVRRTAGVFEASPLDTGGFSHWGRLRWEAHGATDAKVEVATRSGNTSTPDASWSGWSASIPGGNGGPVSSPPARFLQWRVSLTAGPTSPDPELTLIDETFRVENRAPKIEGIVLEEPGVTLAPKADALLPGYALPPDQKPTAVRHELPAKRGFMRGWRSARWTASDPDGDELLYDVYIHGIGEPLWVPLARGSPETYTTWDAAMFPDGRYELKVVARDDASNGTEAARSGEQITNPFDLDSTPPRVEGLAAAKEGGSLLVRFTASDAGIVDEARVSIDGGEAVLIEPVGGISDSTSERYEARIPVPPPGEHLLTVRVQDRAGNLTSAKIYVK